MSSWSILKSELAEAERLLQLGRAKQVLDRLNLVLAQMDHLNPRYAYESAAVLRWLARASIALDERDCADLFIERAIALLSGANTVRFTEKADLFLGLSETLLINGKGEQAVHFADVALDCLGKCSDEFDADELAEILRRYANVARGSGSLSAAYLALTLGLLLLQDMNGLESQIAADAAVLTNLACAAAAPSAIGRVGNLLLRRTA